jgi:hypothetical protein
LKCLNLDVSFNPTRWGIFSHATAMVPNQNETRGRSRPAKRRSSGTDGATEAWANEKDIGLIRRRFHRTRKFENENIRSPYIELSSG